MVSPYDQRISSEITKLGSRQPAELSKLSVTDRKSTTAALTALRQLQTFNQSAIETHTQTLTRINQKLDAHDSKASQLIRWVSKIFYQMIGRFVPSKDVKTAITQGNTWVATAPASLFPSRTLSDVTSRYATFSTEEGNFLNALGGDANTIIKALQNNNTATRQQNINGLISTFKQKVEGSPLLLAEEKNKWGEFCGLCSEAAQQPVDANLPAGQLLIQRCVTLQNTCQSMMWHRHYYNKFAEGITSLHKDLENIKKAPANKIAHNEEIVDTIGGIQTTLGSNTTYSTDAPENYAESLARNWKRLEPNLDQLCFSSPEDKSQLKALSSQYTALSKCLTSLQKNRKALADLTANHPEFVESDAVVKRTSQTSDTNTYLDLCKAIKPDEQTLALLMANLTSLQTQGTKLVTSLGHFTIQREADRQTAYPPSTQKERDKAWLQQKNPST